MHSNLFYSRIPSKKTSEESHIMANKENVHSKNLTLSRDGWFYQNLSYIANRPILTKYSPGSSNYGTVDTYYSQRRKYVLYSILMLE